MIGFISKLSYKSAYSLYKGSLIRFNRSSVLHSFLDVVQSNTYRKLFPFSLPSPIQIRNSTTMAIREQIFDYFLVLDFEATCLKDKQITPQEVIEFPILKVNGRTFNTESKFHQYVQPESHPELSTFCTELTGIIQEQVDGQPNLQETLKNVDKWMRDEGLLNPGTHIVFVTCGDWDLQKMLPKQCAHLNIPVPPYFNRWINIKKSFAEVHGTFPRGIIDMLARLKVSHVGRLHSGIDDCINIAQILKSLAEGGFIYHATGQLR